MWPFITRKKKKSGFLDLLDSSKPTEEPRRPLTLDQFMEKAEGYRELAENDVALKFWLPEPADHAIKELADLSYMTMSKMLRQFLLIHCYGVYAFEWIKQKHPGIFKNDAGEIRFNLRAEEEPRQKIRSETYWVPELGKNIAPVKLWIPSRLKQDLGILAEHTDLTTSNYVREIVISRTLGHGTLPMRSKMIDFNPSKAAEDWNDDLEIPWQEVTEEEYYKSNIRRVETDWMDEEVPE